MPPWIRLSTGTITFCIDALLFALFLLMLAPRFTGLAVHEWLGLALGIPVLLHLLFSWPWITRSSSLMVAGATLRLRINYFLNGVLFLLVAMEIASGVAISNVAMPVLGVTTINDRTWRAVHNLFLNELVLVLGLHLAMNWAPLRTGLRRFAVSLGRVYD